MSFPFFEVNWAGSLYCEANELTVTRVLFSAVNSLVPSRLTGFLPVVQDCVALTRETA